MSGSPSCSAWAAAPLRRRPAAARQVSTSGAAGAPATQAQQAGGAELMAALNVGRPWLARLRGAWLLDYTRNTAEDVGLLFGAALGTRAAYLAAGVSRLTDVANDRQRTIVGVPVELLLYPTRGLEVAIHGNLNSQSRFIGLTVSGVFGKSAR